VAGEAGIPVTSDIERVTARTEELVAAVTVPIFAEHVAEALTGERDLERALRKIQKVRLKGPSVRLKPGPTYGRPDPTYGRPDPASAHALVCATRGARGAMLLAGDRVYHEPARQVAVVDTTGAGDVFRGAFIVALLRGDSPPDILRFANAAAAISCTRVGALAWKIHEGADFGRDTNASAW
jgi:sugar/nucleoside kinase (ribokinase family)